MGEPFDFLRSRGAVGRAEIALAEEHHLLVRTAVLEMQNDIQGWVLKWAPQIPLEAIRDLYDAIGLRKKVKL